MSLLRAASLGFRRLLRKEIVEHELDDEVAHYLEMATREHMRAGMTRAQAERAARVAFGGVSAVKQTVRTGGWEAGLESLWQDLSYGARGLRRNRGFTTIAVVTLALGIGATTAMFSVVNAVMLRPLPYADPGRLALLWTEDAKRGLREEGTAYATIEDWRAQSRAFADMAFFATQVSVLTGGSVRERTRSGLVSENLWSMLGVVPALGRPMTAEEVRSAEPVAMISHGLWQRRFGGDSSVIGKTLELEYAPKSGTPPARIIGVMPAGFYFPDKQTEFWVPATTYWRWNREKSERFPAWVRRWTVVARLRPGIGVPAARTDMARVGRQLGLAYQTDVPDFPGFTANVVELLEHIIGKKLKLALPVLLAAVGLVLLVACANVANLLLARGSTREQELAVRRALGASRGRVARQLLVESLMLALGGGVAGVLLAVLATRALATAAALQIPRLEEVTIDGLVLAFAAAASVLAGIAFGVAPALRMSANDSLRGAAAQAGTGKRGRRTRGALVVVECAVAIVLLTGAGLLLRSLERLSAVDPGFQAESVLSIRLAFPDDPLPRPNERVNKERPEQALAARRIAMMHELEDRIGALPGVTVTSFADNVFLQGEANESITIPGRKTDSLGTGQLYVSSVTPGFFRTLHVPLRRGRSLTRGDADIKLQALWTAVQTQSSLAEKERNAVSEPVVVNEAFVRRFFPDDDPIGRRFCIDPTNKTYWYTIVGVVGDMRRQGLEREPIPEYFGSFFPTQTAELLVRTTTDPLAAAASVRQIIASTVSGATVLGVTTVDRRLGDFSAQREFQTWLLSLFAGLALVLAAIGIYGVMHYAVAQRTREIGVRIALGATSRDVLGLVVREGIRLPAVGLGIGLVAAAGLTRVLRYLLFEVRETDPITFAGMAAVLITVAAAACYFPARRAARVDPVVALRRE